LAEIAQVGVIVEGRFFPSVESSRFQPVIPATAGIQKAGIFRRRESGSDIFHSRWPVDIKAPQPADTAKMDTGSIAEIV